MRQIGYLIESMRPRQWLKNALILAGLIFAEKFTQASLLSNTLKAFAAFCLLSGSVYLLNDLLDLAQDRLHPEKKDRPLASGRLNPALAWVVSLVVGSAAILLCFTITRPLGWCAVIYAAMTISYSLALKHVVIIDLLILSFGFVIRAYAGIAAINLPESPEIEATPWFLSCTLFLALFIAICKRRHEIDLLQESANQHREVLEEYSKPFLDQMVAVTTASTVLTYALYAINQEKQGIIFTLPFVLYGIFRYLYLVYHRNQGGAPEKTVLRDPTMVINILLWLLAMVYIFYR
jgi:4-hydroxybenzoate polyprenyltransferase